MAASSVGYAENSYRHVNPRRERYNLLILLPVFLCLVMFLCGFMLGKSSFANDDSSSTDGGAPTTEDDLTSSDTGVPATAGDTQNVPAVSEADWKLMLINFENPIPDDFVTPELTQLRNNQSIDKRVYPALQDMMDAARADGLDPLITSSFRTSEKQEELFTSKVQSYLNEGYTLSEAEEKASFWVARPGTSEHQAGLAVDIVDMNYQMLDNGQELTPVQQWLMEHCHEYGFILRYPEDKSHLTGVGYEPWHYRYVGKEAAKEITARGICLEEYLNQ